MIKVKHKIVKNDLAKMVTTAGKLNNKKVIVGTDWANAWLVGIHEYGCNITVTPKMRAFLHRQGLHLKDSTTVIKIPERSFMRTGHDKNADRIISQTERAIVQVLTGKMSIDTVLDMCGQQFATAIKTYMRDLSSPANHPFTTERKGSSNPLVDTGQLIESISWETEG